MHACIRALTVFSFDNESLEAQRMRQMYSLQGENPPHTVCFTFRTTPYSCKVLLFIEIFCSMHSVSCNNAWRHALAALFLSSSYMHFPSELSTFSCPPRTFHPPYISPCIPANPSTELNPVLCTNLGSSCGQHGRPWEARVGREEGEEWEERGRAMPSGAIFLGFPGSHGANAPNASRKIVPHAG